MIKTIDYRSVEEACMYWDNRQHNGKSIIESEFTLLSGYEVKGTPPK